MFILLLTVMTSCTDDTCTCLPGNTEGFERLAGSWIRVESNNPSADGIVIQIVVTQGVITDKAESGFNVGDIKWKDITIVDKEHFTHQELGQRCAIL